ncbi:MAG: GNAT family N-acetyltransferase [Desulfococcaceae bacterium]
MKTESLSKAHNRAGFDCGDEDLNTFLRQTALQQAKKELGRTYVLTDERCGEDILGFYTLVPYHVSPAFFPHNIAKNYPKQNIPGVLLGRLAVSLPNQRKGLGQILLVSAMKKTLASSDMIGGVGLFADVKNENVRKFYEKFGFSSFPGYDLKMYLPLKEIKRVLDTA